MHAAATRPLTVLLVSTLLSPARPAVALPEPVPGAEPPAQVPRGAPADQALWQEISSGQHNLTVERSRARHLLSRLERERIDLKLLQAGKAKGPGAAAQPFEALRARLVLAWHRDRDSLAGRRVVAGMAAPVDPRLGCRSEANRLATSMLADRGGSLAGARTAARACQQRLMAVLTPLAQANEKLAAVIAEAEAALRGGAAAEAEGAPAAAAPSGGR